MKGSQLSLPVQLREAATLARFLPGPNAEILAALQGNESLLLYGPRGNGKTHLLHALARGGAAYLPLREFAAHGPGALEGFVEHPLLLLDDLDAITPDLDWALALLRLLDQRHAQRTLLTSRLPPDPLPCALPDLRTRLSRLAVYGLKPLNQAQVAQILRGNAQQRGLQLPDEVIHWMLTHLPRDPGSLLSALETLDRAALTAKRRLTLPFVQLTLGAPAPADAHTD